MTPRQLTTLLTVIAAASISAPALAEDAGSPDFQKADALYKKLKMKEAEAAFRDVIRKEPDNAKAHQRLGAVLGAMGEEETAILETKQSIKLDPKYFLSHIILGQLYANQNKMDLALEEFKTAVALKPTSFKATQDLGFAYAQVGKLDEAIAARIRGDNQLAGEFGPQLARLPNRLALLDLPAGGG